MIYPCIDNNKIIFEIPIRVNNRDYVAVIYRFSSYPCVKIIYGDFTYDDYFPVKSLDPMQDCFKFIHNWNK